MVLEELASSPVPEASMAIGGFLAILIAIMGEKEDSWLDELAVFLAFFIGLFMAGMAIILYLNDYGTTSTILVLGVLGFALFSRTFKEVKWAIIISLIVGGLAAYGMYLAATQFGLGFLSTTVILVMAFIIFVIVFVILKAVEATISFLGSVVSFRPLLFIGGALALLEAVLVFAATSLSAILA